MKKQNFLSISLSVLFSFLGVFVIAYGATVISSNIQTDGTLSVTGLSTLVNATTTRVSISDALWVNGNATTTSAGNFSTEGTLGVAGLSSLTTLKVGASGSTLSSAHFGYCMISDTAVTASSTAYVDCTGATSVPAGASVVVSATSSLPSIFIIQAASSTVAGTINLRIYNTGETGETATGVRAINYISAN